MAIKVKAVERNISFNKNQEEYGFVMLPELYNRLTEEKVLAEASAHSGISVAIIKAACAAVADVALAWIPEGHSVSIPGLGTMRFSLSSKAVSNVEDVGTKLITSKKIIFSPCSDIKSGLEKTSINITCYDRNGNVIKNVNGGDSEVDTDPDPDNSGNTDTGGGNNNSGGGGFEG